MKIIEREHWQEVSTPEMEPGLDKRVFEKMKYESDNKIIKFFSKDAYEVGYEVLRSRISVGKPKNNYAVDSQDYEINGIRVRMYQKQSCKKNKLQTGVFFIHGGGFFAGSVEAADEVCQYLCENSNSVILSIDYSLSPEKKYPIAIMEIYNVITYVYQTSELFNVDRNKLMIGGDSAGGCLSLAVSLLDLELQTSYLKQMYLIYPTLARFDISKKYIDVNQYHLMEEQKDIFCNYYDSFNATDDAVSRWYMQNANQQFSKYISPLLAPRDTKFPKMICFMGEFDPLRPQFEAFVKRFSCDRNYMYVYKGMIHGFMEKMQIFPQSIDMLNRVVLFIQALKEV